MDKLAEMWNKGVVTLKNVIYVFSGIAALVVYAAWFYFRTENHHDDQTIHISTETVMAINKEFQNLRDRIEILEWEYEQLIELHNRRHNKQGSGISENTQKVEELEKDLEQKLSSIRSEIFKYLIDELNQ